LFEKLGITSKYDYVEKIHEKTNDGSFDIHKCSQIIFEAAGLNDDAAINILHEIAANYANGISCMIEEIVFPGKEELEIVFAGSVFVKGEHPLLLDSIKARVTNDNSGRIISFKKLGVPNVAGAGVWALNSLNYKKSFYDKVCIRLQDVK
jgi:N-acetylglucosamine kinase-like BadF-type ATPase